MNKLPRMTTANQEVVRVTGGPYPTGYYDTHIKREECCGNDPDLYTETRTRGFLKEAIYVFRCACGRTGRAGITPNGAAAEWNKIIPHTY